LADGGRDVKTLYNVPAIFARLQGDHNTASAGSCGEHAVRPMAWPMLLRWDGCSWNRNNGMPTLERIRVEA
jgi:hypothetical protein